MNEASARRKIAARPTINLKSNLARAVMVLAVLYLGAVQITPDPRFSEGLQFLTLFFTLYQDTAFAVGIGVCFLLANLALVRAFPMPRLQQWRMPVLGARRVAGLLVGFVLLAWFLRTQVLFDIDLSRDEQMVRFDAGIFRAGHVIASIPHAWRPFEQALNDLFLMQIGDHEAWVSNYLPGNAALLALFGQIMPSGLYFALLAGLGGAALWYCTGKIWPRDTDTRSLVMVMFLGSSQVLLTATTTYAMTAHLTFNLFWLALFLKDRPWSHALALLVGLIATGLHQPVFHPLFVGPFFLTLLLQKRIRLLAFYLAGYGAIALVWLAWPIWIAGLASTPAPVDAAPPDFWDRFLAILQLPSPNALWIQCANALRFVTWQHIALLPLVFVALPLARRDPLGLGLLLGLGGVFVALFLLLPLQGHGWGYRYAHGFIGNACLLAGYGWQRMKQAGKAPHAMVGIATALTFAVALPAHVLMARALLGPIARVENLVQTSGTDVTIVDVVDAPFADNLVINQADLGNRPIRLKSINVTPQQVTALCRTHHLAFVTSAQLKPMRIGYHKRPDEKPNRHMQRLIATARGLNCLETPLARRP